MHGFRLPRHLDWLRTGCRVGYCFQCRPILGSVQGSGTSGGHWVSPVRWECQTPNLWPSSEMLVCAGDEWVVLVQVGRAGCFLVRAFQLEGHCTDDSGSSRTGRSCSSAVQILCIRRWSADLHCTSRIACSCSTQGSLAAYGGNESGGAPTQWLLRESSLASWLFRY